MSKKKYSKPWLQLFKVAVTLIAIGYVGWKVSEKWDVMATMWAIPWTAVQWFCFVCSIVLMPLNYGLEAQKWRLMVRPFYPGLQLFPATKAVFAGMAAGVFTPNRIGEYAGRILFLKEGKRIEAIMATFVDRICQLFVTLLAGLLALLALWMLADPLLPERILGDPVSQGVFLFLSLVLGVISFVMLVIPKRFAKIIPQRWNRAAWVRKSRFALQNLEMRLVGKVMGLAALRYFVFSLQYVLLMYAFGFEGNPIDGFWMVALIFLGKSVLPVMGILELGAREAVALVVMTAFGAAEVTAIGSTLILYFINILLPTLLGVVAMQRVKENG